MRFKASGGVALRAWFVPGGGSSAVVIRIDAVFQQRIGPRAQLWPVADPGHTPAFEEHPAQYKERVLGFLADALR